jgi:DNA polymerase V
MKVIPIKVEAGITGFESPAAEYKELGLSFDELLINHPQATFLGLASGESMQGVGIFDGDLLVIDRSAPAKHHDVIVANYNGEFICKLLDTKQRLLISASSKFRPIYINESDDFQLEGVVTGSIRLHRANIELLKCMR